MKYLILLNFILISVTGITQIITDTSSGQKKEQTSVDKKEKDKQYSKLGIEIFGGVNPTYTFRTLTVNEGLFAKNIGHRASEKGKWVTNYFVGVRNKIGKHLKYVVGAGFYKNREVFNYQSKDSVYNYTNTYRQISFPIKIAYSYGNTFSFYAAVGIIPKAFLSLKSEVTTLDDFGNEETNEHIITDKMNHFLVDAVVTVGTQLKFNSNYGIFILLEGRRQLINNYTNQSPFIRKPFAIGLNVGIEFYL